MPSWDERIAAADDVVLKAGKAVARADPKEEAAEAAVGAKQARLERALQALNSAPLPNQELGAKEWQLAAQETQRLIHRSEQARKDWDVALFAAKDAETAALRARLNWRDAMIDSLQLEAQYCLEREDALLQRLGWA